MRTIRFCCKECGQVYTLGKDAMVATSLGLLADAGAFSVVGDGSGLADNRGDPDYVESVKWSELTLDGIRRQQEEIRRLAPLLESGKPRWWKCRKCSTVQTYKLAPGTDAGKKPEDIVGARIAALEDEDAGVRSTATKALARLRDARAVEPLIAALGDEDRDVREGAASALGKLGDGRAVDPLTAVLSDEAAEVRKGAAYALGRLDDARAVEPLIGVLRDEDKDVREGAAYALGRLDDARAVEPLIAALGDEDLDERSRAAVALEQLGDKAVEPLIAALRHQSDRVRGRAARVLGHIGNPRALKPLRELAAEVDESSPLHNAAHAALNLIEGQTPGESGGLFQAGKTGVLTTAALVVGGVIACLVGVACLLYVLSATAGQGS